MCELFVNDKSQFKIVYNTDKQILNEVGNEVTLPPCVKRQTQVKTNQDNIHALTTRRTLMIDNSYYIFTPFHYVTLLLELFSKHKIKSQIKIK